MIRILTFLHNFIPNLGDVNRAVETEIFIEFWGTRTAIGKRKYRGKITYIWKPSSNSPVINLFDYHRSSNYPLGTKNSLVGAIERKLRDRFFLKRTFLCFFDRLNEKKGHCRTILQLKGKRCGELPYECRGVGFISFFYLIK